MCVYTRIHTHTARGVLEYEPRGRNETLAEPEESRLIQLSNLRIHITVYVYELYMYILSGRMRS